MGTTGRWRTANRLRAPEMAEPMRLNKVLAQSGVASRRKADEMIQAGRVAINDVPVTVVGTMVDPTQDRVSVDGHPIHDERLEYWLVHKPLDVITAVADDRGRPVARDLVPTHARVFPVGRLDIDSTGLVLFTNDGELAHRLMHPSFAHSKRYETMVSGFPNDAALKRLREGIELDDGVTLPANVRVLRTTRGATWLEITIRQGRKRQIRRMLDAVGHGVVHLRRVAIGTVMLGNLKAGEARPMAARELASLRRITGLKAPEGDAAAKPRNPTDRKPRSPGARGATDATSRMRRSTRGGPAPHKTTPRGRAPRA